MRENETILEYVRRRLNACKGEWPKIAAAKRMPYDTIAKIAQGKRPNPTLDNIQPLVNWFDEFDAAMARLQHGAIDERAG